MRIGEYKIAKDLKIRNREREIEILKSLSDDRFKEAELKEADFAFLALPVEATLNIIKRFPEFDGFIDLTSVIPA